MRLFFLALLSYFIGSIPFAFLFIRYKLKKDIRTLGTGNVGAMNSFDVTGSKMIGISVAVLDAMKGILSVLIAKYVFGDEERHLMIASFFAVLGHNYPIWLKLKGGRGLSTAAGSTLIFAPAIPILWSAFWMLLKFVSRNVHFQNIFATLALFFTIPFFATIQVFYFALFIGGLILLRHVDVMQEVFRNYRS
ncbi:protein of unknown function DUF205 [Chloroherpeton thalassium ATCC 35110]|uniref:Glycerol-3-phosphate acyltransferase n=1 Tax=Chloroherpeton thalassium (strain ATCC 35110 / GB-78) TaxID=517418 RepID=B3QYX3_CHLT3|nr:glycerol-3-phosphate acyltransferase [Chloroherpeton thalassium]ACF13666.1 protein of unknown function DUF205 [Chloroherpeton thalassium ATCC 35110]